MSCVLLMLPDLWAPPGLSSVMKNLKLHCIIATQKHQLRQQPIAQSCRLTWATHY